MWTEITRSKYERVGLRYASDLSDGEWALIGPLLPPARRLGRPRRTDLRAVVNGLLYMPRSGCPWRLLPKDFPPRDRSALLLHLARRRHLAPDQPRAADAGAAR